LGGVGYLARHVDLFVKALDDVAVAGRRDTPDATATRLQCIVAEHRQALRHVVGCGDELAEPSATLRADVIRAGGRLVQRLGTADHAGAPTDRQEILGSAIISLTLAGTCEHSSGPPVDQVLADYVRGALAVITGELTAPDSN
jgi:hypothetical protein